MSFHTNTGNEHCVFTMLEMLVRNTSPTTKLQVEGTAKVTKLRYTGGNETEADEAISVRWNKPDNATDTTTWFKICDVDIGIGGLQSTKYDN